MVVDMAYNSFENLGPEPPAPAWHCAPLYPRILVLLFVLALVPFTVTPAFGEEPSPASYRVRFLYSIDGGASKQPFLAPLSIFVDKQRDELYVIDEGLRRIVIMSTDGAFLYEFQYMDARIRKISQWLHVDPSGDMYLPQNEKLNVLDYRGFYKGDVDLSTVPESDRINMQSVTMDSEGRLYIGDNVGLRVVVLDRDKKFLFEFGKDGEKNTFTNLQKINVDSEGIYVLDPGLSFVYRFDREGNFISQFGKMSSLPGGFSMPVDLAVNEARGWIAVVDVNRYMVIVFNREGEYLFEFGGPRVFFMPRSIAVDEKDRIYVLDNTNVVRVFKVIVEETSVEAGTEPEHSVVDAAPVPDEKGAAGTAE